MTTKPSTIKQRMYLTVSIIMYALTILITSGVFLYPPDNFNARALVVPIIILLFISSIGIGYKLASNASGKTLTVTGALCITILMTFIGFFLIAGVGWFVGVYHSL